AAMDRLGKTVHRSVKCLITCSCSAIFSVSLSSLLGSYYSTQLLSLRGESTLIPKVEDDFPDGTRLPIDDVFDLSRRQSRSQFSLSPHPGTFKFLLLEDVEKGFKGSGQLGNIDEGKRKTKGEIRSTSAREQGRMMIQQKKHQRITRGV